MAAITDNSFVNIPAIQPQTVDSVQNLKNRLFGTFQTLSQQTEFSEQKIASLEVLYGKITELSTACSDVDKSNDTRLKGLVWWKRFLEKLAYMCHLGIGTYSRTYYAVQAARTELVVQTMIFQKKEFDKLSKDNNPQKASIHYVRLYELIQSLHPEYKEHLAQYADRLMIEGAFQAAIDALQEFMKHDSKSKMNVKHKLIKAMHGAKKYQQALDKIAAFKVELNQSDPRRAYIDLIKVDCLIDQKNYKEAESELSDLLKADLDNEALQRKMVQTTELEELSERSERYFMAASKDRFVNQRGFKSDTWAKRDLVPELAFWMHLLITEKKPYEDNALFTRITDEIMSLIEHKKVTADSFIKELEKMANRMKQQTQVLSQQYHVFTQETSKEILVKKEVKEEIMAARMDAMKANLHGNVGSYPVAGIMNIHRAVHTLLSRVTNHEHFSSSEQKTKLQAIKDSSATVRTTLVGIATSLSEIYQGGYHPYISTLQTTLGTPEQIRAISS